jgi:hypothetical protein
MPPIVRPSEKGFIEIRRALQNISLQLRRLQTEVEDQGDEQDDIIGVIDDLHWKDDEGLAQEGTIEPFLSEAIPNPDIIVLETFTATRPATLDTLQADDFRLIITESGDMVGFEKNTTSSVYTWTPVAGTTTESGDVTGEYEQGFFRNPEGLPGYV